MFFSYVAVSVSVDLQIIRKVVVRSQAEVIVRECLLWPLMRECERVTDAAGVAVAYLSVANEMTQSVRSQRGCDEAERMQIGAGRLRDGVYRQQLTTDLRWDTVRSHVIETVYTNASIRMSSHESMLLHWVLSIAMLRRASSYSIGTAGRHLANFPGCAQKLSKRGLLVTNTVSFSVASSRSEVVLDQARFFCLQCVSSSGLNRHC
nr:hypothetical protein CFP56_03712 [Quercus suber]